MTVVTGGCLLVWLIAGFFLQPSLGYAQASTRKQSDIPMWVAWRTFHDSLNFYDKRDSQATRKMLKDRLGLSTSQAAELLSAGKEFLAELGKIEEDARAEVMRRYPANQRPRLNQAGKVPSIRAQAIADGLDAQIESQRKSALSKHRQRLSKTFDPITIARINGLIQSTVVPHITKVTPPTSPPAAGKAPAKPISPATLRSHIPLPPPNLSKQGN